MKKYLREWRYAFLTLHQREQRGIIIFAILAFVTGSITQLLPYFQQNKTADHRDFLTAVTAFKASQKAYEDSVTADHLQSTGKLGYEAALDKLTPFPFDPNRVSDSQWIAMGLTLKQASTIRRYREKGGRFKRKEDLRRIYVISEGEYRVLEPFIQIGDTSENPKAGNREKGQNEKNIAGFRPVELNGADSAGLTERLKLRPWLASRTIRYRDLLGGFFHKGQLYEVYGFDSAEIMKRWDYIQVDTSRIKTLDLNNASFKDLLRHPYLTFDEVQSIFNLKAEQNDMIRSEQLLEQGIFTSETYQRLRPYLKP